MLEDEHWHEFYSLNLWTHQQLANQTSIVLMLPAVFNTKAWLCSEAHIVPTVRHPDPHFSFLLPRVVEEYYSAFRNNPQETAKEEMKPLWQLLWHTWVILSVTGLSSAWGVSAVEKIVPVFSSGPKTSL